MSTQRTDEPTQRHRVPVGNRPPGRYASGHASLERPQEGQQATDPAKKPAVTEVADGARRQPGAFVTMFGLMALGIVVILLNYMGILPGGTTNWYLLGGLAMIGFAYAMTLNYR